MSTTTQHHAITSGGQLAWDRNAGFLRQTSGLMSRFWSARRAGSDTRPRQTEGASSFGAATPSLAARRADLGPFQRHGTVRHFVDNGHVAAPDDEPVGLDQGFQPRNAERVGILPPAPFPLDQITDTRDTSLATRPQVRGTSWSAVQVSGVHAGAARPWSR